MARQTPGNYVPLDVNYARDIAVRKAGTNAELLYIRSLAYAKGARTSGFVSDFDLEVVAVGMRAVKAAAQKLVEVGLWVRVEDGWLIRSWERWNASDQIVSAGGKLGNHKRWHIDRGEIDPECEHCTDRTPIAPRSHPDSPPMSPPESQGKGREGKGSSSSPSADADEGETEPDPFDDFWASYPRKVQKPDARKAWKAALKKATASEIIDALKAYPFGDDKTFIAYPATWLNKESWADEPNNVRSIRPQTPDGPNRRGDKVRCVQIRETGRWRQVYEDEVLYGVHTEWRHVDDL
jgi:hypothetical protein